VSEETKPCIYCDAPVQADVWQEELSMCVDCSNKFFEHKIDPFDDSTWPKNQKPQEPEIEQESECTCDPCGDRDCDCYGKRCDFCLKERD